MSQSAGAALYGFAPALTSFVGRAEAIREVAGLLDRHRLVTVTGPGGCGKTRLAAEVASRAAAGFADGVWLAELAGVRDSEQVPAAVAVALGLPEMPDVPQIQAVARACAGQQLLLVLDNCEHVIDAAACLCTTVLSAADEVRILATSREPLRVAGETRYRLAPLAVPDELQPSAGSEAVTLFADRAGQADPHFTLGERTLPSVARLVRRLDGMPLAIELAAARVESLGVGQLADLLHDRFDLLGDGNRLAASRHRSLAATMEWSYRLLDEREQRVFRALSVFPGPFTLEAAEAVAGAGTGVALLHLVDCSLLVPPRSDPDGRSRYAMLETLRAYGAGLLTEAGEDAAAAAALGRYAVNVAERAATGLRAISGEEAAASWLDAEEATTRQALAWASEHDPGLAFRLAVALAPWWFLRGRSVTGSQVLAEAARVAEPGGTLWSAARFWLGRIAMGATDLSAAFDHLSAVCDAAAQHEPSPTLVDYLAYRSLTLSNLGRAAEAAAEGQRALALARDLGYAGGESLALAMMSVAAAYADDLDEVVRLARQSQRIHSDIPGWIARPGSVLVSKVLVAAGKLADAERAAVAGLDWAAAAGDLRTRAFLLVHLAYLDLRAGRFHDAASHLREALQLAYRFGNNLYVLNCLDEVAHLCAATGRAADAVTSWAALDELSQLDGCAEPPSDARRRAEPLRKAREALPDDVARVAADRGAAMSMTTAVQYALMLTTTEPEPGGASQDLLQLSARERELVTLVARGRTDAQIAQELVISVRTVGSHLDRIREKTGCRRRADLTRLAFRAGLL
ncbi:MAG TPA: LuxR C-terminal-related transcriptional regulator [Streptosporangiaceae bacterium]|nr:LuxR C-terminal-related transcriptional regulator [Streptosporangiaceae bacterium]